MLNKVFNEHEIAWHLELTHKQGDGIELARQGLADGKYSIIAAYGGDGTVGEVAQSLHDTDMPMAVLPGGTGNAFARSLGISHELEAAARLLADPDSSEIVELDTGLVNDEWVLTSGGATGLVGRAMDRASRDEKDLMGLPAYILSLLREMQDTDPVTYTLDLDDRQEELQGVSCLVANAGSVGFGNLSFFDQVSLRDGLLDIFIIKDATLPTILNALVEAASQDLSAEKLPHFQASSIRIDASAREYAFSFDGNRQEDLPVRVKANPHSLKVLVPMEWIQNNGR